MIAALITFALVQSDPSELLGPDSPAFEPNKRWEECLKTTSERLYNKTDSSETIAKGAASVCGPQRLAVARALYDYFLGHQDRYEKPNLQQIEELLVPEGQEAARLYVLDIRSRD